MGLHPDTLTGTPELTQYNTYQVVCPIFDARPGLGNFIIPPTGKTGIGIPKAMRNPYSEAGFVRVVNMIQAQYYFLERHYNFDLPNGASFPNFEGRNWAKLKERTIDFLGVSAPSDEEIVARTTSFVQLPLGLNGQTHPDSRQYWVHVATTRNQLFTPETEGRLVIASPRSRKNFDLWRSTHQPRRMQPKFAQNAGG